MRDTEWTRPRTIAVRGKALLAFVLLGAVAAPAAVYAGAYDVEWLSLLIFVAFTVSVAVTIASIGPLLERRFPRAVTASDAVWRWTGVVLTRIGVVVWALGVMALWLGIGVFLLLAVVALLSLIFHT